jgi:hypothetical protein
MTVPLAAPIIAKFETFLDVREIQPNAGFTGTNATEFRHLLLRAGWSEGLPYCAFACSQIIFEQFIAAGIPLPDSVMRSGSSSALARDAEAAGKLSEYPATGCVGLLKGGSTGWYHTVLVTHVNADGTMNTIEANCQNPNNPDEQGVFRRHRYISDFDFCLF